MPGGRSVREGLDHVWAGDVERLDIQIAPGSFDAIVCGKVLEHFASPGACSSSARVANAQWSPDRQHSQRAASQRCALAVARELDLMHKRCSNSRVREFPGDLETLRERCQFLFHHGTVGEAEQALGR